MGESVLGAFLSNLMHQRNLSNRALAQGAGVSEGVIRNLLLLGNDENAKDPDPRTLIAVGKFLDVDASRMFKLAGYINDDTFLTAQGEYVGILFDRLSSDKQRALLQILRSLLEVSEDRELVQYMVEHPENPLSGTNLIGYPSGYVLCRLMANSLLTGQRYTDITDMPEIGPDTEIWNGRKLSDLDPDVQEMVLDLVKAKLSLDYDVGMKGFTWKK